MSRESLMPSSKSAAKRDRQNEKRRIRNKARSTELKTLTKKFLRAIHDGHKDEAESLYRRFTKRLDQAAARNIVHKNTASRRKGRLGVKLSSLAAA
jgi:small subunit ribosomal protein S20